MAPVITKNGSSLQVILPKHVCESERIGAGDRVNIKSARNGIIISPTQSVKPETGKDETFTIGYEGRTLDSFVAKLKSKGIKQIIDVRANPSSRKKGFSKNALNERLELEEINYVHMPNLGPPKEIRDEYKAGGSSKLFFEEYEDYIYSLQNELAVLLWYVKSERSALMCFELSYTECHRKILAKKLNEKDIHFIHI